MAKKKKSASLGERLGDTVTDMIEAVSFAATGSPVEVLEQAAEDEMKPRLVKGPKKKAVVVKPRISRTAKKPAGTMRASKRR